MLYDGQHTRFEGREVAGFVERRKSALCVNVLLTLSSSFSSAINANSSTLAAPALKSISASAEDTPSASSKDCFCSIFFLNFFFRSFFSFPLKKQHTTSNHFARLAARRGYPQRGLEAHDLRGWRWRGGSGEAISGGEFGARLGLIILIYNRRMRSCS